MSRPPGADDEPFLARWSRRKRELPAESETLSGVPEPQPEPVELPDPASLAADSDFRPFMRSGVDPGLRRDALRRLWRLNPHIGAHDGLDDCFLDFTDAATCVPDLRTLYRVGQGMVAAVEEIERLAAAKGEAPRLAGEGADAAEACPEPEPILSS